MDEKKHQQKKAKMTELIEKESNKIFTKRTRHIIKLPVKYDFHDYTSFALIVSEGESNSFQYTKKL